MFDRLMRGGCAALLLASLLGIGCDDPLATLEQARTAIEEGKKAAITQARADALASAGTADAFADDEEARRKAGGISLGPEHAKRLYYQFIDGRGRVAFVERLGDVPAQWRDRVGFVEMESPPPLSPAMAEQTRDRRYAATADKLRQPRAGGQVIAARTSTRIVLYSADWCGWCKKAQRHLDAAGVDYELRDIDIPENLDDLVAKTGQKGIPVLEVGGKVVTGFSPGQYDQLIRDAT
jgi:glutaredoxin